MAPNEDRKHPFWVDCVDLVDEDLVRIHLIGPKGPIYVPLGFGEASKLAALLASLCAGARGVQSESADGVIARFNVRPDGPPW